ncbi:MAG: hypothetical protein DRP13_02335 [Candidatus Aenigmatarchaeota archaeon]|nr:MAG: hypothetical protein DRP13_02335 [Candidatus Aenigmarchaeota archaeon]
MKPLGFINFDGITGETNEVEIIIPKDRLDLLRRGQYIRIESSSCGEIRNYLARIVRGPFYVPDAVKKDSAFSRAAILHADEVKFRPDYHGVCKAQIIGEIAPEGMRITGAFSRPHPQAAIYPLSDEEIERHLELEGDMYLGKLYGYPGVRLRFPAHRNAALPRNLGIFGTVGSGKTNTSQVLIEEASFAGWAVIVIDVEGEYVDMDKPSEEKSLYHLHEKFGIKPEGLKYLKVYHCVNTEPARSDSQEFSIRFSNIRPEIISEIINLTEVQEQIFLEIYFGILQQKEGRTRASGGRGLISHLMDDDAPKKITLNEIIERIDEILSQGKTETQRQLGHKSSLYALRRKLRKLQRQDIFDKPNHLGDYSELVEGGKVSVIDLSGSYNEEINNIVIVDLLRSIFKLKLKGKNETPVIIIIEEAHTLVSEENAKRMNETLDILREISRRGRKRWISLCFVSQQPSHLPQEIYELCNTKIIHQTTSGRNLNAIKNSTGSVNPAVWDEVPVLGQGRCLFISSVFKNRSILADIRICKSKRRYTEE